ncbi:VWA domain-containing protein [Orbaceae bacterium ESL0721]|nr:VWA domain-containing protein [Orbaceae bacterium ESL0721]
MQRITRIAVDSDEKHTLLDQYQRLLPLLQQHLTDRTFSIFAKPRAIGNDIGWYSDLEGQPILLSEIQDRSVKQAAMERLQARVADLEKTVQSIPLTDEQRKLVTSWLPRIKSLGNPIYVINGDPVIVNNFEPPILPPPPVVLSSKPFWNGWRIALLALFLLALLGLLWYLFCPWGKERTVEPAPTITQPVVETPPAVEPEPVLIEPAPVPEPVPEPIPEPKVEPKPVKKDPNCISQDEIVENSNPSKMVLVFDNSASMLITLLESDFEINRYQNTNYNYYGYYERMTRLPNRLSESKKIAKTAIDKVEPNINISLVTLSKCPVAEVTPFYKKASRSTLKKKIDNLQPLDDDTATPLYSGIDQASKKLDGVNRDDYILVISDGEDNCTEKNICTLASNIAKRKPRLKISIVDIAGQHKIDCVANKTGGKIYIAKDPDALVKQMNKAVADLKINRPICK